MDLLKIGKTLLSWFALVYLICGCRTEKDAEDSLAGEWPMHHINQSFKIANSLEPGDVNKDGFEDYAVIDESLNLYTIVFHPGSLDKIYDPWPTTIIHQAGNPEYSCIGDLDGDGNLDLIGVEGDDNEKGYKTGVRVIWGPEAALSADGTQWVDGGHFPGTENRQYLYLKTLDINADGAMDIVVGGRVHPANRSIAGLFWLEAPLEKQYRRNLDRWKLHYVDSTLLSGHGFVYSDINGDGFPDFVIANADWDTPDSLEMVLWYENPGTDQVTEVSSWKKHIIHQSPEYYGKPQIGVGDLDGDGLEDLCVQTAEKVYFFRKLGIDPVTWETVAIPKPPMTQWLARATNLIDINNDGKLDIVGMLIHDDGNLPSGKASVFWMEYEGDKPGVDNWKTHVIKWSHGIDSGEKWVGEKWDHCRFIDMDGDGDLDIVANAEEFYKRLPGNKHESYLSVVWFENKLNEQKFHTID